MAGIDPKRPLLQERAVATMMANSTGPRSKKSKLVQVRAARFFGVSDRQGQRMASGDA
jgi:hypothetical protein